MKKLILVFFFATFFIVFANGQNELSFVSNNIDGKAFYLPVNELNTKAARHFNHEFSFAGNESWFKIRDGYTAKFMFNAVQYRVGYDKKGNWLNTVKIYHESEMPKAIRHQVKTNYYDYAITLVEELAMKNLTIWIVHIDNEKGFKKLFLSDGEMKVIEAYSK